MPMYRGRLSRKGVLKALKAKAYSVCQQTGEVYNARGRRIVPFVRDSKRRYIRIYYRGLRRVVSVAGLVWMVKTSQVIPPGFEIHHLDRDKGNDSWDNIICVCKMDHRKLHRADQEVPLPE